ncbi:MAG: cysteine dioxygenase [Burkholderiaceae bacterium]
MIQQRVAGLMRKLIAEWRMPDERYRKCQPDAPYGSYLLFLCPSTRLSIVLDVFAPGQVAAVHDHGVWGVFGCLAGIEIERRFALDGAAGSPPRELSSVRLTPGEVRSTDPAGASFHQVECAGQVESVSLHVYGDDIGRLKRRRWDPAAHALVTFSSGYSNDVLGYRPYLEADFATGGPLR